MLDDDWYRRHLAESQAAAHDAYDQALLKLSGGALGLSLALVRGFAADDMQYLIAIQCAWGFWAASLLCVIASFHFGAKSAATQARQYDADQDLVDGGADGCRARWCNRGSGLCFGAGVLLAGFFMIVNLNGSPMSRDAHGNPHRPDATAPTTREQRPRPSERWEERARDPHPVPPRGPRAGSSQPAATPQQGGTPTKKSN